MRLSDKAFWYATVFALCTIPSMAPAAKCAGTNINNLVAWEPSEISKGTNLALLRISSVTVADDPSAPYHLISGECIGQFLTAPDGKTVASGSCARSDKSGDVLYEEWVATDGVGNKGTWKLLGGTGKFANAKGTAQWEFTQLHGKTAAVRWNGNCQ